MVAALLAGADCCAVADDASAIVVSAATRTKSDGENAFIDLLLTVVKNRETADPTGVGGSNYVVVGFGIATNIPAPEDRSRKLNVSIPTNDVATWKPQYPLPQSGVNQVCWF